ncbi:uncharacterized protein BJ171DRAFT_580276 [Polychytrium aggregatum]|uniref:uncharacterized protein n=1 Tax=Polychytrium aggregatum TaxID=110093 RepID=UPI0022FF253A|nr:uncharacterized protein BJ171DRAFT_580276 [Polychytrium aggregatum]KAI9206199.1 hypothetical protein BJ171DRAFT_580276 [Polychytrium aggregatum]
MSSQTSSSSSSSPAPAAASSSLPEAIAKAALSFPQIGKAVLRIHSGYQSFTSNLSPQSKESFAKLFILLYKSVVQLAGYISVAYAFLMDVKVAPSPTEWQQPGNILLQVLANLILLFAPTVEEWADKFPEDGRALLVANQNLYGLDLLPLLAVVYLKTGKLVRTIWEPFHFKTPIYKHLIEYFGGVCNEPHTLEELMEASYPVVIFPGGMKEALKSKEDAKYGLMWPMGKVNFARSAIRNGYTIIPVASVGVEDMLQIVHEISPQDFDFSAILGTEFSNLTIPLAVPGSYERLYIHFGDNITTKTKDPEKASNDVKAIKMVRDRTRDAILAGLERLLELQESDPKRFILDPLWKALEDGKHFANEALEDPHVKNGLTEGRKTLAKGLLFLARIIDPYVDSEMDPAQVELDKLEE